MLLCREGLVHGRSSDEIANDPVKKSLRRMITGTKVDFLIVNLYPSITDFANPRTL